MEPEKICPFMSRPADKDSAAGFIPCQKERCMAWVTEYRMTPIGHVPAHCKMLGLEGGTATKPPGPTSISNDSYQAFD
jgi:hypothetical protein